MVLRIATEIVAALRYKLRTFSVFLEGPLEVYCDNKSEVKIFGVLAPVLNKVQRYMLSYL